MNGWKKINTSLNIIEGNGIKIPLTCIIYVIKRCLLNTGLKVFHAVIYAIITGVAGFNESTFVKLKSVQIILVLIVIDLE